MRLEELSSPTTQLPLKNHQKKKIYLTKAKVDVSPFGHSQTKEPRDGRGLQSSLNFLERVDITVHPHSPVKKKPQVTHRRVVSLNQHV